MNNLETVGMHPGPITMTPVRRRDFTPNAIVLLASILLLVACRPQAAAPGGTTREQLIEAMRAKGTILYVYPGADSSLKRQYGEVLGSLAGQGRRLKVMLKSDTEVTDADLHEFPLVLVGTVKHNAVLRRLLPQLPFNVTDNSLQFNGQQYGDHPTLGIGYYPNPLAPTLPLSFTTGLTDEDVLAILVQQLGRGFWGYGGGWGYQVHDGGRRKVMGFFDESDPKQWRIGSKTHWDFTHDGKLVLESPPFKFYDHQGAFQKQLADSIAYDLRSRWDWMSVMLALETELKGGPIHLYPSCELKGLATGNSRPASIDETDSSLHLVLHPAWQPMAQTETAEWMLRKQFPMSAVPALNLGIAQYFSGSFDGHSWKHWAATWHAQGAQLSIPELLDPEIWEHESPYLKRVFSAALFELMLREKGPTRLLEQFPNPDPTFLLKLRGQWEAYLVGLPRDEEKRPQPSTLAGFQKGFNFAHEGYQIFNGYLSAEAKRSIGYTADSMACNTIALIPYAGLQDVHKPDWITFSDGPGAENDESIEECIWAAQQQGLTVMIKPQLWPWNDWTGEVEMQNDADWRTFFDHYYRWIRHYAIMAQLRHADLLCMGVELSKTTLQRPEDWRNMAAGVRKLYSGKLCYAANWGEELEKCRIWDAMDYIGANCYYPLSDREKPSQKELDKGFEQVAAKLSKVAADNKKPLLLTEIGYRSCAHPWQNPHADSDGRPADNDAQEACYKAMIKGLGNAPWCQGIYLWKWPAYLDDAPFDPMGFSPVGKPAQGLILDWFQGMDTHR